MQQRLLTVTELCSALQTSRRNIELLRKQGLPFYQLSAGGHPRFDLEEVKAWMKKNTIK